MFALPIGASRLFAVSVALRETAARGFSRSRREYRALHVFGLPRKLPASSEFSGKRDHQR